MLHVCLARTTRLACEFPLPPLAPAALGTLSPPYRVEDARKRASGGARVTEFAACSEIKLDNHGTNAGAVVQDASVVAGLPSKANSLETPVPDRKDDPAFLYFPDNYRWSMGLMICL